MTREPIFCFWKGKECHVSLNLFRVLKVSDGLAHFVDGAGRETQGVGGLVKDMPVLCDW